MSLLTDLDDYKLQTEFRTNPKTLLHRSYRADWAHGRPKVVVQEEWVPQKPLLGVGSFGLVRLEKQQAVNGETFSRHKERAVKQLRKIDLQRMRVDFRKELQALTKFSRSKFAQTQAFVEFFGWFEDEDHVYLAMEYFHNGTLDRFITKGLSEQDSRIIAQQLLEGLRIMHQEQFTHRDLKPQNIFVVQQSPYWWVKIGDFGISKRAAKDDTVLRTSTGTPLYLAPEVFHYLPMQDEETGTYTNAVDIWSFACVVYEMLTLRVPFADWPKNLVAFCNGGPFPEVPLKDRVTSTAIDFVKSVLVASPDRRPTAKQALESPWFGTEVLGASSRLSMHVAAQDFDPNNFKEISEEPRELAIRQNEGNSSHDMWAMLKEDSPWPTLDSSEQDKRSPTPENGSSNTSTHTDVSIALSEREKGLILPTNDQENERLHPQQENSDPSECSKCHRKATMEYYFCRICNFSLCGRCDKRGYHCSSQDHWMIKSHMEDSRAVNTETEILKTGWALRRLDGTKEPTYIPPPRPKWNKSYKIRAGQAPYDFCFQCGITFPSDDPPNRHEWEMHGTIDAPVREPESPETQPEPANRTVIWMKDFTEEEAALHAVKLKRMEDEMNNVFKVKVHDKEDKLQQSETELYARYKEMDGQLQTQRKELEERLATLKQKRSEERENKKRLRFGLW